MARRPAKSSKRGSHPTDAELIKVVLDYRDSHSGREAADFFNVSEGLISNWARTRNKKGDVRLRSGLRAHTREALLKRHKQLSMEASEEYRVFDWLRRKMDLTQGSQHAGEFERFAGQYDCYRLGLGRDGGGKQNLIIGSINIEFDERKHCPYFSHTSAQDTMSVGNGIEEETYLHDGFIFIVQNRLYFLGVGQTIGGPYLRPMIMKNVDPKKEPIKGMLLTERKEGNIPLATKTIMVREDMPNKPSLDQIRADLENESEFDHILYGWGDA